MVYKILVDDDKVLLDISTIREIEEMQSVRCARRKEQKELFDQLAIDSPITHALADRCIAEFFPPKMQDLVDSKEPKEIALVGEEKQEEQEEQKDTGEYVSPASSVADVPSLGKYDYTDQKASAESTQLTNANMRMEENKW